MYRIEFFNYYNNVVFGASKKSLSSAAHYGRVILQMHEKDQWWAIIFYSEKGYEHISQIGYIDKDRLYIYNCNGEAEIKYWDEI